MSQCQTVCDPRSTYNAVNIKINNPKANISDKIDGCDCNGDFNAVNLEINNPQLRQKPIYSYPGYDSIITYDMLGPAVVDVPNLPVLPVEYKASFVDNRTYITPDTETKDAVNVPEPKLTTIENEKGGEKKNIVFNGLNFRASNKPEIVADAKIKPAVNTNNVLKNLESADYDVQAKQLEEIVYVALKDKKSAQPYITESVFSGIIDIAEKDSSALNGPSEEQINIRKKIIANEIVRERQLADNKKSEEIILPYTITNAELAKATVLSPMEMVERNKEYALLTIASLAKVYAEEFEEKTGNIVYLTDLPGASTLVDTLKKSKNPSVKIAAVEALVYLNRPEYRQEIATILEAAKGDKNPAVAMIASDALKNI